MFIKAKLAPLEPRLVIYGWKEDISIHIHKIYLCSIQFGILVSFLDWTLQKRTRNAINLIITPSVPLSSFPPLCAGQMFVQIIVEIHLQYKDD